MLSFRSPGLRLPTIMPTIALLHTSAVHEPTFRKLIEDRSPDVHQRHTVRGDWLDAARSGGLTEDLRQTVHDFLLAEKGRADAVLCTCSTLGPLVDSVPGDGVPVIRIDRPMMAAAVATGGPVLIAYCLESTREPTLALFDDVVASAGGSCAVNTVFCDGTWTHFESGAIDAFAKAIASSVRKTAEDLGPLSAIVLAQASMAPAAGHLADLGIPVLSSPAPAVEAALKQAGSAT
ncbi:MAG: aspartate/glutamate racemase family protein [Pseudomonadota bacterium]